MLDIAACNFLFDTSYKPCIFTLQNHINEDILGLSIQQITVLVDYIIEESREATTYEEEEKDSCGAHDISDIAEKRMQLLCRCCCGKYNLLKAVIVHLTKRMEVCRFVKSHIFVSFRQYILVFHEFIELLKHLL